MRTSAGFSSAEQKSVAAARSGLISAGQIPKWDHIHRTDSAESEFIKVDCSAGRWAHELADLVLAEDIVDGSGSSGGSGNGAELQEYICH